MRHQYVRAMQMIQRLCLWIASLCVVVITLVVPWGVFTRYVLGHGSSWPEPLAQGSTCGGTRHAVPWFEPLSR